MINNTNIIKKIIKWLNEINKSILLSSTLWIVIIAIFMFGTAIIIPKGEFNISLQFDYLAFGGAVLGGIATMFAVLVSIKHTNKTILDQRRDSVQPFLVINSKDDCNIPNGYKERYYILLERNNIKQNCNCKQVSNGGSGSYVTYFEIKNIGSGAATHILLTIEKDNIVFKTPYPIYLSQDSNCYRVIHTTQNKDENSTYGKYFITFNYRNVFGDAYKQKIIYNKINENTEDFEDISEPELVYINKNHS